MNMNYEGNKVLEYLANINIEAYPETNCIKISRDSIVNEICNINSSLDEEGCYECLIGFLKTDLGGLRFFYSNKNDDYLWLDIIGK